jgi:hypothetical protein
MASNNQRQHEVMKRKSAEEKCQPVKASKAAMMKENERQRNQRRRGNNGENDIEEEERRWRISGVIRNEMAKIENNGEEIMVKMAKMAKISEERRGGRKWQ